MTLASLPCASQLPGGWACSSVSRTCIDGYERHLLHSSAVAPVAGMQQLAGSYWFVSEACRANSSSEEGGDFFIFFFFGEVLL